MEGEIYKECTIYKQTKSITKFKKNKGRKYGVHSWCRMCCSIIQQKVKHTVKYRMKTYRYGAKRRNLDFNLDIEEFDEITKKRCVYCGEYSESINEMFCGLDRIDSNKGYTKDNIVPCCWKCNNMKGALTTQEFSKHIKKIYKRGYVHDG